MAQGGLFRWLFLGASPAIICAQISSKRALSLIKISDASGPFLITHGEVRQVGTIR
jgi:hypothetical protein